MDKESILFVYVDYSWLISATPESVLYYEHYFSSHFPKHLSFALRKHKVVASQRAQLLLKQMYFFFLKRDCI
jgi:hypothetical protein